MAFGSDRKPGPGEYGYDGSGSQSFFSKTMRIEGEITSDEDLTIEGKVQGKLDISKTLVIGKEGFIDGKISASKIRISGVAEGELTASEKLEITSDGKFTGDIFADTIRVAEGAQLKGSINIEDETKPKPKEKKVKTPTIEEKKESNLTESQNQDSNKPTEKKETTEQIPEKKEQTRFEEKKEPPKD